MWESQVSTQTHRLALKGCFHIVNCYNNVFIFFQYFTFLHSSALKALEKPFNLSNWNRSRRRITFYSTYVNTSTTPTAAKHVNAVNSSICRIITLWELHLIDTRNISSVNCKCNVCYYDHIWHNQYSVSSCGKGLVCICNDGIFFPSLLPLYYCRGQYLSCMSD